MSAAKNANFKIRLLTIIALTLAGAALLVRRHNSFSSAPDPDWASTVADVVRAASRGVVAIETEQALPKTRLTVRNAGSGFIIDPAGLILTNEHVIHQADTIRITLYDHRCLPAVVVGSDIRTDLAVLKIDAGGLDPLPLTLAGGLTVGQPVVALGNPMGTGSDGGAVATYGLISRLDCSLDPDIDPDNDRFYDNLIQTTAITLPGSSGGPVINSHGQVIGVNTAVGTSTQTARQFGFAIAMDDLIRRRVDLLKNAQPIPHAFLGAVLAGTVGTKTQKTLGVDDLSGTLVDSIMLGFPAQQAGLLEGDLIRAIDGKPVLSRRDLMSILNHAAPRQTVTLDLFRADSDRPGSHVRLSRPVILTLRKPADVKGFAEEASLDYLTLWGMHLKPLTPWRKDKLRLPPQQNGVLVYFIESDSPAHRLGIAPGCVITEIDNHAVRTLADLHRFAKKHAALPPMQFLTPPPPND